MEDHTDIISHVHVLYFVFNIVVLTLKKTRMCMWGGGGGALGIYLEGGVGLEMFIKIHIYYNLLIFKQYIYLCVSVYISQIVLNII